MKRVLNFFKILIIVLLFITVLSLIFSLALKKDEHIPTLKQYTVTFDVGEYGNPLETMNVNYGNKPVLPVPDCKICSSGVDFETGEPVILDDYKFLGWYLDNELVSSENITVFDRNVTLTAKWQPLWIGLY